MRLNFLKSLDADDIFISYSRRDGSAYLTGLDAALSKQGFSCFTDKRGTDAGRLPPETLYRKVRSCKTLVLLASPGAQERPENITPELKEFAEDKGTSRIICVSFDGGEAFDDFPPDWEPFVIGKAREREAPGALTTGTPSEAVVAAVVAASDYMKSKDRLRKYRNRAIGVLGALVVAIAVAAVLAGVMFKRAVAETAKAAAATTRANAATDRADAETARAAQATQEAKAAQEEAERQKDEAKRQKDEADKQKGLADLATKDAQEKTKLADAATARAEREQARAERQGTIADATALAIRSQTVLRQRPEDVSGSLSYAVDASKKAEHIGFRSADADAALRESLSLLPLRRSSGSLRAPEKLLVAISPDGLHYALLDSGVLRVYVFAEGGEAGGGKPLLERPCECSVVALDSGAAHAAAVLDKGGFKIFDLKNDSRSRVFDSFRNGHGEQVNSAEDVALSPSGQYLALNVWEDKMAASHSALLIYDVTSGEPVKIYDDAAEGDTAKDTAFGPTGGLDMYVYDVAFGPTGDLAIGGKARRERRGGSVVIWHLHAGDQPTLNADSFQDYETVAQEETVLTVAPGADETVFATDTGVWRRFPSQSRFEPVARIPYPAGYVNFPEMRMAFRPDGRSIALVRRLSPITNQREEIRSFEVWDALGYTGQAEVLQIDEVTHVGFEPGGRLVATLTDSPSEDLEKRPSDEKPWRRLRIYNAETGAETESAEPDERDIFYVSSDAAHVVALPWDSADAHVWDVWAKDGATRKSSVSFSGALDKVNAVAVGRGGRFLALEGPAGGSERIVVYRRDGGAYTEVKRFALSGKFSRKERGIMPRFGGGIDLAVANQFSRSEFNIMAISADGRRLVVHPNPTAPVRIFDDGVENAALGKRLGDTDAARIIVLSADGRYLAVWGVGKGWGAGSARLLDTAGGSWETLLDGKDGAVTCMAFSPGGDHVGVGTHDGLLHVFETARSKDGGRAKTDAGVAKEKVARLQHADMVTAVAFSDDGRYVATASEYTHASLFGPSSLVRVWLLRPSDLIAESEKRLARGTPSTR